MDKRQTVLAGVLGLLAVAAAGGYWWTTQQNSAPAPAPSFAPPPAPVAGSGPAMAAASGMAADTGATGMASSGPAKPAVMAASGSLVTGSTAPANKPTVSDAVALSEEELDKLKQEQNDLDSRAQDLQSQVHDGKTLLELKQKQIKELEAQLKASKGSH
jgi:hypothetical protein